MARNATALQYAVRIPVVLKYYGQSLLVLSGLLLPPLFAAAILRDGDMALWFLGVTVVSAAVGFGLNRLRSAPGQVRPNEALAAIALAFLTAPFVIALPLQTTQLSYINALFESVSGCTTTGLTVVADVDEAPASLLFARAWMQWFGGLGISVLSIALITTPGVVARSLATDLETNDLVGSTRARARLLCIVFTVLTGVIFIIIAGLGLGMFEALLFAFASVSTGGFAPRSSSLADLSLGIQVAVTVGCIAGAFPIAIYGRLANPAWRNPLNRRQALGVLLLALSLSILLVFVIRGDGLARHGNSLRHALLLATSAQTTAGFSSVSVSALPPLGKVLLLPSMLIGGCMGSTAGGIKMLRALILLQVVQVLVRRQGLAQHAVERPNLGGQALDDLEIREACALLSLYLTILMASWIGLLVYGYPALDSLFEVCSAVGTVGLSAGLTSPDLPTGPKMILCAAMWLGRLEIFAWIVLISPRTWFGRRTEVP